MDLVNLAANADTVSDGSAAATEQDTTIPEGVGANNAAEVSETQAFAKRIKAVQEKARIEAEQLKQRQDEFAKNYGFNSFDELEASEKKKLEDAKRTQLDEEAAKRGMATDEYAELQEMREFLKKQKQKELEAEQQRANAEKANAEVKAFQEKYPDVDLSALINKDEKFKKFVKGRAGNIPLVELYEDFVDFLGEAAETAIAKIQSKTERSTDSGNGSGVDSKVGLTPDEIGLIEDHNKRYPNNKITFKEFKQMKSGG